MIRQGHIDMNSNFNSRALARVRQAARPLINGGLSDADTQSWFEMGYGHFEQARYQDALRIFALLVMARPGDARSLAALGASHQMLGQHDRAVQYLGIAQLIEPANPLPTFHFARSLIALGAVEEAAEALDIVIAQTDGVASHGPLCARARMMRARMDSPTTKENA